MGEITCQLEKLWLFYRKTFQSTRKILRDEKFNLSTGERLVQRLTYVSGTKTVDEKILCLLQTD